MNFPKIFSTYDVSTKFFLGFEDNLVLKQFFLLYIANYNLLNIDRVISKVEVREGREAGTIHRWFTVALLLG